MQQQRDVFCGGLKSDYDDDDTLHLDVSGYTGSSGRIKLQIDQLSKRLAQNIPDLLVDLLEIATYVYSADQLTRRETPFMTSMGSCWRRRLRFVIPVRRPDIWMRPDVKSGLISTLCFLSEDEFIFDFSKMKRRVLLQAYLPFDQRSVQESAPDEVILFSGGLDSLAGAIQSSVVDGKNVLLVSHQSSNMIASKQRELVAKLRLRSEAKRVQHVSVIVSKGKGDAAEYTQRTRSFLFAVLGLVAARMYGLDRISLYENGIVSINLPISDHVLGARASRTTHPQVLKRCSEFFTLLLGRRFDITNPYLWWTKTDVVRSLAASNCGDLIAHTFSCAKVREATRNGKHCGVCSQCIDRRFGVLAAGLEAHEPSDTYSFDLLYGQHRPGDDLTLSESFVSRAQRLSSMTLEKFVSAYGQIFRVMAALPISADASARQIWELHQRHGKDVVSVVDSALSQLQHDEFQGSSLLALVSRPTADQPGNDQAEKEDFAPVKGDFASAEQPPLPVLLGIDARSHTVLFEEGIELKGDHYEVLSELAAQFEMDRLAGKHPDERGFVSGESLAKKWNIEPPSVRRRIQRARDAVSERFVRRLGRSVSLDDLIQNVRPRGYRLNPTVALVDPSILRRA